jgi:CBS domain-containing protein
MPSAEHYHREVATIPADAPCFEIASRMRSDGLGSLVVVEGDRPVGIVTDRDLLCRALAAGRGAQTTAREIMSQPLVTAAPQDPLERVVERMSAQGIRRVPVVRDDELVGIVSLDDLLAALGGELGDLGEGVQRAYAGAQYRARARALAEDLEERVRDWSEQVEQLGGEAREGLARRLDGLWERIRGPRS